MKALFVIGAFLLAAPVAQAQIRVQIPGVVIAPERQDYWRGGRDNEWRRREEYRDEQHQRAEWQHSHCVRDWQNQEFCRR